MKKILLALFLFLLAAIPAQAQVKISDMPPGGNIASTDLIPIIRGTPGNYINYNANIALGSSTTAGILQCGGGVSCSGGVITGASPLPSTTSHAAQYLTSDGTTISWQAPASLIDPRTYGAACVGPGYTGGLTSASQGILVTSVGAGYTNATYTGVPIIGGTGGSAVATVIVSGGVVSTFTITTAGSGYKLRDQITVNSASIGGTGGGFTAQVAHFSGIQTPVYDNVHDDTAAFQIAFAVAQNTGQGVLVPNGCWVSTLTIPQGVSMVGTGYTPNYGFNAAGDIADNQPVLYIENSTPYGIKFGKNPNNAFFGFQINDGASGAYQTAVCIGTDVPGNAGDPKLTLTFMGFYACNAALGTLNGSTFFPVTLNNIFSSGMYGVLGNASDWFSSGDTFNSNHLAGARLGGAGEIHIVGARFEENDGRGLELLGGTSGECDSCQFDTNKGPAIYMTDGSGPFFTTGGIYQSNGFMNTTTGNATFVIDRPSAAVTPANLTIQGAYFSTFNGSANYVLRTLTTGTLDDNLIFTNNNFLAVTTTAFGQYDNGQPPHMKMEGNDGLIGYFNTLDPGLTLSGCSATNVVGGQKTGAFTAGVTGACNVTVVPYGTTTIPQPHGFACGSFLDKTTTTNTASWQQLSYTTTAASLSGTTSTGDVVSFNCNPF